ncbi:hypothetical protein ACOZ38_25620 [Sphaerisporangium viridialbum]|uniref:hypothetical protein n=1 Tax=Sphaerisporangium viridialbum TaxID=46189 RepID=UPI003C7078CB
MKQRNPNTDRNLITTKAHLAGWRINAARPDADGVTELTFTRDDWQIVVACQQFTAFAAAITYPGQTQPAGVMSLGLLARYLRGNREQMSAVRRGERVLCGERVGIVQDIIPDDEVKVRLVLHYDDNTMGEPYTTHVQPAPAVTRYDRVQLADGTLAVVLRADDQAALVVRADRSEQSTTVAADTLTRLFGPGDRVVVDGRTVGRVLGYTRNQCYRVRDILHDTTCDHPAWKLAPISEEVAV